MSAAGAMAGFAADAALRPGARDTGEAALAALRHIAGGMTGAAVKTGGIRSIRAVGIQILQGCQDSCLPGCIALPGRYSIVPLSADEKLADQAYPPIT